MSAFLLYVPVHESWNKNIVLLFVLNSESSQQLVLLLLHVQDHLQQHLMLLLSHDDCQEPRQPVRAGPLLLPLIVWGTRSRLHPQQHQIVQTDGLCGVLAFWNRTRIPAEPSVSSSIRTSLNILRGTY